MIISSLTYHLFAHKSKADLLGAAMRREGKVMRVMGFNVSQYRK